MSFWLIFLLGMLWLSVYGSNLLYIAPFRLLSPFCFVFVSPLMYATTCQCGMYWFCVNFPIDFKQIHRSVSLPETFPTASDRYITFSGEKWSVDLSRKYVWQTQPERERTNFFNDFDLHGEPHTWQEKPKMERKRSISKIVKECRKRRRSIR